MSPFSQGQPFNDAGLDALAETIAVRVADLLTARAASPEPALVDAATLAQALGISRATVYEHADALGARRLTTGSRARLRFNLEEATTAWQRRTHPPTTAPPRRTTPVALLPVHQPTQSGRRAA